MTNEVRKKRLCLLSQLSRQDLKLQDGSRRLAGADLKARLQNENAKIDFEGFESPDSPNRAQAPLKLLSASEKLANEKKARDATGRKEVIETEL